MKFTIAQVLLLTIIAAIAARTLSFSEYCYGIVQVPLEVLKAFRIVDLTGYYHGDTNSLSAYLGVLTGAFCCWFTMVAVVTITTMAVNKVKDGLSRPRR